MKIRSLFKRILPAAACVVALLGSARPAAASAYFYTIIGPPNWGAGNPQPPASWSAFTFNGSLATTPFKPEDYVSLSLLAGAGSGFAYDTFFGESRGFIGADVSVVGAWWTNPVAYWWAGGPGPLNGGALLFFNSFNNGNFYANELIIGDPMGCNGLCELQDFETQFGLSGLTNTEVSIDPMNGAPNNVTFPGDNNEITPPATGNYVDYDIAGNGTDWTNEDQFNAPEAPTGLYLLTGVFALGAVTFLRRRRHPLPTAE